MKKKSHPFDCRRPFFTRAALQGLLCSLVLALSLSACGDAMGRVGGPKSPTASDPAPASLFGVKPKRQAASLLVVGDSLSISLGRELERSFAARPGVRFAREGKVSSGLAAPDFYNWPSRLENLTARYKPDVVVVMIAANDDKTLREPGGEAVAFGEPGWRQAYARRVRQFIRIAREANPSCSIFWVGAPVMGRARLTENLRTVNAAIAEVCKTENDCHFVDTWKAFSDAAGRYVPAKSDLENGEILRGNDGVHMTDAGARVLSGIVQTAMAERVQW